MGVTTEKFIRKPLYVDAVRLTAENFDDIVAWCGGEVLTDEVPGQGTTKKYIKVRVHNPKNPRQTKAFIGDWLLYTERGYKVYTNKAFRASFDSVEGAPPRVIEEVSIHSLGVGPLDEGSTEQNAITMTTVENGDGVEVELVRPPIGSTVPTEDAAEASIEAGIAHVEQPMVSDSDSAPPPQTADGRRILTRAEQVAMSPEEVQELLRSGQAVLEQDFAPDTV